MRPGRSSDKGSFLANPFHVGAAVCAYALVVLCPIVSAIVFCHLMAKPRAVHASTKELADETRLMLTMLREKFMINHHSFFATDKASVAIARTISRHNIQELK